MSLDLVVRKRPAGNLEAARNAKAQRQLERTQAQSAIVKAESTIVGKREIDDVLALRSEAALGLLCERVGTMVQ